MTTEPEPARASAVLGDRIGFRLGLIGRPPGVVLGTVVVALGLLGADLFGIVHIVGGSVHGNGRAATFGVELAAVTTALLGGLVWTLRRTAASR